MKMKSATCSHVFLSSSPRNGLPISVASTVGACAGLASVAGAVMEGAPGVSETGYATVTYGTVT